MPSLPNIVVQIYRVINDEDADARKIARVIQADPGITARLLSTANSTFYRRARSVTSCVEAVVRLGPSAVRSLVTTFVMRELFQSRMPIIQHHVKNLWAHSAMVAAISYNLARATPYMNPDTALLAGLLHDIGTLCILGYAESHPELLKNGEKLASVIATLRGELGADILRRWEMPAPVVNATLDAEDWHRDPQAEPDYSDLVLSRNSTTSRAMCGCGLCPEFTRYRPLGRWPPADSALTSVWRSWTRPSSTSTRLPAG